MANPVYENRLMPVNKMAGMVTSPGTHFEQKLTPQLNDPDRPEPYEIRPVAQIPVAIRHLVGLTFGRLKVLGYSTQPKRWVVRCTCGTYSLRSTAAVTNPANLNDSCRRCYALMRLQTQELRRRTGKDLGREDMPGAEKERAPLPPKVKRGRYEPRSLKPKDVLAGTERPRPNEVPLHVTELQRRYVQDQHAVPTALALALASSGLTKSGK